MVRPMPLSQWSPVQCRIVHSLNLETFLTVDFYVTAAELRNSRIQYPPPGSADLRPDRMVIKGSIVSILLWASGTQRLVHSSTHAEDILWEHYFVTKDTFGKWKNHLSHSTIIKNFFQHLKSTVLAPFLVMYIINNGQYLVRYDAS